MKSVTFAQSETSDDHTTSRVLSSAARNGWIMSRAQVTQDVGTCITVERGAHFSVCPKNWNLYAGLNQRQESSLKQKSATGDSTSVLGYRNVQFRSNDNQNVHMIFAVADVAHPRISVAA